MTREDVLNKAKRENKVYDEWEVDILKNSNIIALILLVVIIGLMLIISLVQHIKTGTPFANPFIFVFQLVSILAIQSFTKYCYNKKTYELITAVISIIGSIYIAIFLI